MSDSGSDNGCVRVFQKHQLTLVYDTATHQVSIVADGLPLSLAQMICDEGARVLDGMRRMAALGQMQKEAAENARVADILARGGGRG